MEVGFRWPLSRGVGTLACAEGGAILFRTGGVTYAVSGISAKALDIEPLRVSEPTPPPSNPLSRVTQVERMHAFREVQRCESHGRIDEACRGAALARFGLSRDEWAQIDVEGHERRWPPLPRGLMSLDPLIAAGRALCGPASAQR